MTAYILFQRDTSTKRRSLDRYTERAGSTLPGHEVQVFVD